MAEFLSRSNSHIPTSTCTGSNSSKHSVPAGISVILDRCQRLYPNQTNPLQASPTVKFWLGGPDPLDYISMYLNAGDEKKSIPEHWHYISFGLSDLYGDCRIHPLENPTNHPEEKSTSGFGFELTFRLKRAAGELTGPLWPAKFLQDLARYVFSTDNSFISGDHVSWHRPLDGSSESRIQHVIMATDPQLRSVTSALGSVEFIQAVGICKEELEAAQHWNGRGVLELLRSCKIACGPLWITDMQRDRSIFEIEPQLAQSVQGGINQDGSDLSGVSCSCWWTEVTATSKRRSSRSLSLSDAKQIRTVLQTGLEKVTPNDGVSAVKYLDTVHLSFNLETGSLLGLALCGRLLHGRHFTFRSVHSDHAVTFVSAGVEGTVVSRNRPFAAVGSWLQVYLEDEDILEISDDVRVLTVQPALPYRTFSWPNLRLNITVTKDETLFVV